MVKIRNPITLEFIIMNDSIIRRQVAKLFIIAMESLIESIEQKENSNVNSNSESIEKDTFG